MCPFAARGFLPETYSPARIAACVLRRQLWYRYRLPAWRGTWGLSPGKTEPPCASCFFLSSGFLGAVLAYLLFAPIRVEPVAWQPPPAPATGAGHSAQRAAERDRADRCRHRKRAGGDCVRRAGPDLHGPGGRAHCPLRSGWQRLHAYREHGRPAAWRLIHPDGSVIVCDAKKGLLKVAKAGDRRAGHLGVNGVPLGLANDLAVTADGSKVYFTDTSTKFAFPEYQPRTHRAWRLWPLPGLRLRHGQNAGSVPEPPVRERRGAWPGRSFRADTETGSYRILRYWLKGEKAGISDIFADNLPGFPDNITFNGRDRFWVALYAPRTPVADKLAALSIPAQNGGAGVALSAEPVKAQAFALAFNPEGKLVANLQYDG